MNYNDLCSHAETGDILLFKENWWFSRLIQYFTNSKYSHCGIIIKNPNFTPIPLRGLYLLESTGFIHTKDAEDHEHKFGVQLTHSKTYLKDNLTYIGENYSVNEIILSMNLLKLYTPLCIIHLTTINQSTGLKQNFKYD